MKIWFDMVTKRDARLRCGWWNGRSLAYFFRQRSWTNSRFWMVMRDG